MRACLPVLKCALMETVGPSSRNWRNQFWDEGVRGPAQGKNWKYL